MNSDTNTELKELTVLDLERAFAHVNRQSPGNKISSWECACSLLNGGCYLSEGGYGNVSLSHSVCRAEANSTTHKTLLDIGSGSDAFASYLSRCFPGTLDIDSVDVREHSFLDSGEAGKEYDVVVSNLAFSCFPREGLSELCQFMEEKLISGGDLIICDNFFPSPGSVSDRGSTIREFYEQVALAYFEGDGLNNFDSSIVDSIKRARDFDLSEDSSFGVKDPSFDFSDGVRKPLKMCCWSPELLDPYSDRPRWKPVVGSYVVSSVR